MQKLVITQNVTVDGAIEMLGDWFDPQLADEDLVAETQRQDAEADALLVGRRTFEDFRSYWPSQSDDTTGVSGYLNKVAKYVVSSTMTDPQWANSTVLAGDPVEQTRKLKSQPGQRHRVDGKHQPGACADRRRAGRRIPAVRLPDGAGRWTAAVPRRRRHSEARHGQTAQGLRVGHHAAALRGGLIAPNGACPIHRGGRIRGVDIERPDAEERGDDDRDETEAQRLDR